MQNFSSCRSPEDLAHVVIQRRKAVGYTQVQAAKACGVSISFMNKLENGKATIQIGLILKVFSRLGIDLLAKERALPQQQDNKTMEWIPLNLD
jgi:transcriptional regulator with XRE-family HTH domain